MTLTDADLAWLEALDRAATAGPATLAARGISYAELFAEFRNYTPDLVAELREARAALARVKALHQPEAWGYSQRCVRCSRDRDRDDWERYPCPTLRAIEGASGE